MDTQAQSQKSITSAKLTVRIKIAGCPERGLEALAWRRERGLSERMDDRHDVSIDRPITEAEFQALLAAGGHASYFTDGSASVAYVDLAQEYSPIANYGHCATIEVVSGESDVDLIVRALAACKRQQAEGQERARVRAESEAADKEAQKAKAREELLAVLPRILAGEGDLEGNQYYVLGGLDGRDHRRDAAGDEVEAQIDAEAKRRRQIVTDERDAWIAAHGSNRLRKGAAAGLISKLGSAYREERIAHDLGSEWRSWDAVDEDEERERLNPSEAEIDALLDTRKRWPDEALEAQLRSVRDSGGTKDCEYEATEWVPALMIRLPWERDRWAIRYL
jgi:hypothetical protein